MSGPAGWLESSGGDRVLRGPGRQGEWRFAEVSVERTGEHAWGDQRNQNPRGDDLGL